MQFSQAELQVFDASKRIVVADVETPLFWVDRWMDSKAIKETSSDLFALIPKHARKRRTVREVLLERCWIAGIHGALSALALCQYLQLWIKVRDVQVSEMPDSLVWRWTANA
jgi:hypothetical protein